MKKLVLSIVVLSLMFGLVACGDKKDAKKDKKEVKTTAATTEQEKTTEATTAATTEAKTTTEATTEATTTAKSTTEAATEAATEATTEDLSDTSSNLAKPTVPAYASDGSTVYLTLQEDETWTTDSGAVYYEGTDGVLRSRGNPDLTFKSPDEQ